MHRAIANGRLVWPHQGTWTQKAGDIEIVWQHMEFLGGEVPRKLAKFGFIVQLIQSCLAVPFGWAAILELLLENGRHHDFHFRVGIVLVAA